MTTESISLRTDELDARLTSLTELATNLAWDNDVLTENLSVLELQLERRGWESLTGRTETELDRSALRQINNLARAMWLKNPLIQRGVNVQSYYVFGQGVEVSGVDEEVDEVVQAFWNDAKNQAELTLQQALLSKDRELTLFGNFYLVLFVQDGRTLVRTIPPGEIADIICNPDDAKEPWWYKRVFQRQELDGVRKATTTYYKDWRYLGDDKPTGKQAQGADFETAPVFHIKVGGLSDMKFGVSEVYAALDWARSYKGFLENWATIVSAYARFAWRLKVKSRQGIASAKAKLDTTLGTSTTETNPAPVPGSTFIGQPGVGMEPIRTAGATTSAEDGRRLLLMVASVFGLPESFFGDVSVGNLATAKSLDRPTELKFVSRQTLWGDSLKALLYFVLVQAVEAKIISGTVIPEEDGTPVVELYPPQTTNAKGETVDRETTIKVEFPPILEHDVMASVDAIVKAATLGGSAQAGTIDPETLTRMLLTALGEKDVQAVMDILFPPGWEDEEDEKPESELPEPGEEEETEESQFTNALRGVRRAVEKILEE